ncbi:L,D-transpeptidase [Paracoccus sp. 1_MG-2023]|uniref:L,D-transpeptidase family protein n=1 Tax=unclassified Paracoccus (in: a-proteobacteria) TaxID=2688777 RepID=UPI001C0915D7|nr:MULTISPECIES: L,D-transpeptidase [unclassified Paracoccus (in: a-proteobacteria)]MBU2956898.1 L,D-transpeptidase [Paracoccus sp. C2R09]MDO6668096.1 L,D-transpeptidase [Paracoccus sp. 1_MG-2023]
MPHKLAPALLALALSVTAVHAQDAAPITAEAIESAQFGGGDLPGGRSALTAKVQILLDRSGTSPGVIDGYKGEMSRSALMAFERRASLPMDGVLDPHVWNLLQAYAERPVTQDYTITEADAQGLVDAIPTDYAEKAQMTAMAHTSVAERLAERFHMDERFIAILNPNATFTPGEVIRVMAPNPPLSGRRVTRILIDKATRRVAGYDANGNMVADYPATIGSSATPSPEGSHQVRTVAVNPNYTYNPNVNFKQGDNDKPLIVPPGPNGPVGSVWIGLSKPTYGIHGTPTPSQLFRNASNGCVRLTNWDAEELAKLVSIGGTSVEFLPTDVTIADALNRGVPATDMPVDTPLALPADTQPSETAPVPAEPLTLPADPAQIVEDTREENAVQPQADPLTDALDNVLPEGFVVPPLEQAAP